MKIGVIADTHIPRASKRVPEKVFELFHRVELIIHAGDIVQEMALKQLETIAPVIAVHGIRDSDELKASLPESRIIELKGFKIGILHGHGEKGTTMQRLPGFFAGENLDCIIFGHSHIPYNQKIGNTLYFNPGSPTVKKRQKLPSVGILTLSNTIESVYRDGKNKLCAVTPEDSSLFGFGASNIRKGFVDMIALGRQSFADPLLPLKLREGREDEIKYCTVCDNCLELLIQQSPIGCCTYNKYYTDVLVQTRKEKGKLKVNHT